MASRLTRWSVVTMAGVGLAMALLLPPGISPLAEWLDYRPAFPTNALDAAVEANRLALDGAQFSLREVVFARQLAPFLSAGRSPLVLRYSDQTLSIDPVVRAVADSLWKSGERSPVAPRTLLIAAGWNRAALRAQSPNGTCIAALEERMRNEAPITILRADAGGCLLAARFGPPGRGLGGWLGSGPAYTIPGTSPRLDGPVRLLHPTVTPWVAGHAQDWEGWWSSEPAISACLAGRSAFCVEALDLGPERRVAMRWAFYRRSAKFAGALPAALMADLGPDRFAEVWRSDDPLPISYTKATGRPFDEWAMNFAQHLFGRLVVETGMSWIGWVGWLFWMALFFGWLVVRMREQPAQ